MRVHTILVEGVVVLKIVRETFLDREFIPGFRIEIGVGTAGIEHHVSESDVCHIGKWGEHDPFVLTMTQRDDKCPITNKQSYL